MPEMKQRRAKMERRLAAANEDTEEGLAAAADSGKSAQ